MNSHLSPEVGCHTVNDQREDLPPAPLISYSVPLKAAGKGFLWTSTCAHTCGSTLETDPTSALSTAAIRSLRSQPT